MVRYEWLTPEQIESEVNPTLLHKGMAQLNPDCCRVLGAYDGDTLIETFTVQLFPILGPMVKHDAFHRDNGEVSRALADKMHEYLTESNARGFLVIADNPVTQRLCERHGMRRMDSPVYAAADQTLECNDYTSPPVKVLQ